MKNKIVTVLLTFIISFGMVIFLFGKTEQQRKQKNNFIRHFPSHFLANLKEADLGVNSYYFAGITKDSIYLGNITVPLLLTSFDLKLKNSAKTMLQIEDNTTMVREHLQLRVHDSIITLINTNTGELFDNRKSPSKKQLYPGRRLSIQFAESIHPADSGLLVKYFDAKKETSYIKAYFNRNQTSEISLEKQGDGHFSEDGYLMASANKHKMGYFYYYRNQFIIFNHDFSEKKIVKTIDTISRANIKLKEYSREDGITVRTMSHPPTMVNRFAAMDDRFVYINSSRIADNEDRNKFTKSSVVDTYEINSGDYKFSFYVPDFNGEKIRNMTIVNKTIYVFAGNILIAYSLAI